MAADVMLALGEFQFSVDTAAYQELTRTTNYKWASQERFNNAPAVQFTGFDDETINLAGVIYPQFRGGLVQLDDLRELATQATPLQLLSGQGYLLGTWVVLSIEEKQSNIFAGGVPQKIEFTLRLKRFDSELEQSTTDSSDYAGPESAGAYVPEPTPTQPWSSTNYGTKPTITFGDGSNVYLSRVGDTLANIAQAYYGKLGGRVLERLYEANRGLASLGAVLPPNVQLSLPTLPNVEAANQSLRLWK